MYPEQTPMSSLMDYSGSKIPSLRSSRTWATAVVIITFSVFAFGLEALWIAFLVWLVIKAIF
jgi:hypothetical protein